MTDVLNTQRRITGWRIEAVCPHCAGILEHIADGRPGDHGLDSRAIAGCTACGRRFAVAITISDVSTVIGRRRTTTHRPDCPCPPCARHRARLERGAA